ncbi:hypothetical protein STEG23_014312 [Scotinomys teguina]
MDLETSMPAPLVAIQIPKSSESTGFDSLRILHLSHSFSNGTNSSLTQGKSTALKLTTDPEMFESVPWTKYLQPMEILSSIVLLVLEPEVQLEWSSGSPGNPAGGSSMLTLLLPQSSCEVEMSVSHHMQA